MVANPLKPLKKWINVYTHSIILVFLVANCTALIFFSGLSFQRLGSFWVALLLVMFALTRLLSDEMLKAVQGRGLAADIAGEKLDDVTYSENRGRLNYMSKEGVEYEQRLLTKDEIARFYSEFDEYLQSTFLFVELSVGAVATLQWGYGDLFHDWFHDWIHHTLF